MAGSTERRAERVGGVGTERLDLAKDNLMLVGYWVALAGMVFLTTSALLGIGSPWISDECNVKYPPSGCIGIHKFLFLPMAAVAVMSWLGVQALHEKIFYDHNLYFWAPPITWLAVGALRAAGYGAIGTQLNSFFFVYFGVAFFFCIGGVGSADRDDISPAVCLRGSRVRSYPRYWQHQSYDPAKLRRSELFDRVIVLINIAAIAAGVACGVAVYDLVAL
jgi:hypothetical protein